MKYRIADLNVEMDLNGINENLFEDYKIDQSSHSDVSISDGGLIGYNKRERKCSFEEYRFLNTGTDLFKKITLYNGIMIHSSAVVVDNKAYLFSACCGTGKSTHTSQWLKLFGENAYIINDDKPILRIFNNTVYVYGSPWCGKNNINKNAKVELKGICFIERDEKDWIKTVDYSTSIIRLYHSTVRTLTQEQTRNVLSTIDYLAKNVPIYLMGCTPTINAAKVAYETMSKNTVKREVLKNEKK